MVARPKSLKRIWQELCSSEEMRIFSGLRSTISVKQSSAMNSTETIKTRRRTVIDALRVALHQSIDDLQEDVLHQFVVAKEQSPLHNRVAKIPLLAKLHDQEEQSLSIVHLLQDRVVKRRDVGMG